MLPGLSVCSCQQEALLWKLLDVLSDNRFLSLLETSIQTSFSMTVKVDGVSQDGATTYIHTKVHNRTRTLTCAGVSVCDISTVLSWTCLPTGSLHTHC